MEGVVDAHAGLTETSLMLHIRPDSVHVDLAQAGNTAPIDELLPVLVRDGVRAVSPNGVLGDPDGASADEGRRVLKAMASKVVRVAAARSLAPSSHRGGVNGWVAGP
jgi:creatinine amidohydrolase/Fe(II)-dependent formamide hydrolase-like protein